MKSLGTDKVTRAALILIALGIWSLLLVQIRVWVQPRTQAVTTQDAATDKPETGQPRYQMVRQNDNKMFLLDTRTGHVWGAVGENSVSNSMFIEVTPGKRQVDAP